MEYSINELSRISGVTPRTLRWYDKKGILKPSRIGENGYRYYGAQEVNRLQEILFYKALGIELDEIKKCLDDPGFNRIERLNSHLSALDQKRKHIDKLIKSVQETVKAEERNEIMSDNKKFEAFKNNMIEENERVYGMEVRSKYGDGEVDAANKRIKGMSEEQYARWTELEVQIKERLEYAVMNDMSADGDKGKEIFDLHKEWLTFTIRPYDAAKHKGIAEMYVLDERFTSYYDKNVCGCAVLLRDIVRNFCK